MRRIFFLLPVLTGLTGFFSCNKESGTPDRVCTNSGFLYNREDRFLALPTAFTPNEDRVNDDFLPITNMNADSFSLKVLDTRGKVLYQYSPSQPYWDGSGSVDYEYTVEVSVKTADNGTRNSCSPLFRLRYDSGKCVSNAREEDLERYVFTDQFNVPNRDFSLYSREKFCF